jgi:hypothetical protein
MSGKQGTHLRARLRGKRTNLEFIFGRVRHGDRFADACALLSAHGMQRLCQARQQLGQADEAQGLAVCLRSTTRTSKRSRRRPGGDKVKVSKRYRETRGSRCIPT